MSYWHTVGKTVVCQDVDLRDPSVDNSGAVWAESLSWQHFSYCSTRCLLPKGANTASTPIWPRHRSRPGFSGLPGTVLCGVAVQRGCTVCERPESGFRLGHGKGAWSRKKGALEQTLSLKFKGRNIQMVTVFLTNLMTSSGAFKFLYAWWTWMLTWHMPESQLYRLFLSEIKTILQKN